MLKLVRTDNGNLQFQNLVKALDADLAISDGEDHEFYNQYNGIENINHVIVGYINQQAVACGAIKKFSADSMEMKRMYVHPDYRGKEYAVAVLNELEIWSLELGFTYCVLETGVNQAAAIRLYQKTGYERIDNYGQYTGVANSFCFRKKVSN
jgi:GNAT superfamily N-acetyltransferase